MHENRKFPAQTRILPAIACPRWPRTQAHGRARKRTKAHESARRRTKSHSPALEHNSPGPPQGNRRASKTSPPANPNPWKTSPKPAPSQAPGRPRQPAKQMCSSPGGGPRRRTKAHEGARRRTKAKHANQAKVNGFPFKKEPEQLGAASGRQARIFLTPASI